MCDESMYIESRRKSFCKAKIGSVIKLLGIPGTTTTIETLEYDPKYDVKFTGQCTRALINGYYWYVEDIVIISI